MMRDDAGTSYRGPLAGLGAGAAAVLLAGFVVALAWHRVAGQVSAGITVLVYAVITVVCGMLAGVLVYVFLWLRHRVRHPETLAPRRVVRAQVLDPDPVPPPQITAGVPAIGPPRVYLNVTADQLAALMRGHAGEGRAP